MAVNLTENINKIEDAINKFRLEMDGHDNEKQRIENDILRLEGSKIVYEGLRDVFGDVVGGSDQTNSDCHRKSSKMETVPEEHKHPEAVERDNVKPDDSGDMSLEDLYKKYRAM